MNQKQSSYLWVPVGAPGQHHFTCLHGQEEIGQVWRTLSTGQRGVQWVGRTKLGAVVRSYRKEEAAHLLREASKTI